MSKGILKTHSILDEILAHKAEEVAARKAFVPLHSLIDQSEFNALSDRDPIAALRGDTVRLIAEIKRASPSRGVLMEVFEPVQLAITYANNGAAAISVLTDEKYFMGNLDILHQVRRAVNLPLLCKEFIIDPYQVYEAAISGADIVLLIAAALDDGLIAKLAETIHTAGMTPLIEVHNRAELERVLPLNPKLIGINNRDLKTFTVDLNTTAELAALLPGDVTLVAESGIQSAADVARMAELGAHAVLVGEGLVTAPDISAQVRALAGVASQRHDADKAE